jgi:hypothetical protein
MVGGLPDLGRALVLLGGVLVLVGIVLILGGRLGLGHLPGDILYRKGNFTFYFPLATSILLSAILTLVFFLLRR